ncbi:hypothetical protein CR513_01372, partial [Mucuna pruriens]
MYIINGYKFHTINWSEGMNSINHGVYVRGTNGQLESDFYGNVTDIIQLEYTGFPIMKLVLFKCDWFDNTPNIGTKVHNKYEIVEVRTSRRYNKAYNPFIFAQQVEQVYYTPNPYGHHSWLVVIKTKTRSRIIHNILPQIEQEAPYQDDDFVGLQVVLHIDPDVINKSLVDIHGGGEELDRQLLDQTELYEPNKDKYITIESDFSDTNTSYMENGGTSDGRRPLNHDKGRDVSGRSQPTINSPTSISHISTLESTISIHQQGILPTIEEEPQPTKVGDRVVTPSTLQDSFTPDYPSPHSEHAVDQRSLNKNLMSYVLVEKRYNLKFVTYGSESLRWDPSWEQSIRAIFQQKGSHIFKIALKMVMIVQLGFHSMFEQFSMKLGLHSFNDRQVLGRWWRKQKLKSGEWINDKTCEIVLKYQ